VSSEVRLATTDDDLEAGWRTVGAAFLDVPSDDLVAWRREIFTQNRTHVALEDGTVCGVATEFSTPLTLPGGASTTMAAVTAVGVLPTHRRRGHLSRLMEQQLTDVAKRGVAIAGLIAAEWPIYGRYGYGSAIPASTYEVDSRLARFAEEARHGSVELVDRATFRELAPPVFEAHHASTPGAIGRAGWWWEARFGERQAPGSKAGGNEFRAVHRAPDGRVDGYATYTAKGHWERSIPSGRLDVTDLVTTSSGAYADLWRFLCEVDWTVSVKASPRPADEPLPFLLVDGRAVQQTHHGDHIWLRLLDVPAVLAARAYRGADRLVLDVVDESLGRGGRYALDASPAGATCTPTDEPPDLTLPIGALGAMCMGGTPALVLAAAGQLDEEAPGATARLDALMSWSPAPFCSTNF
jgi:predicted acetyltransferase